VNDQDEDTDDEDENENQDDASEDNQTQVQDEMHPDDIAGFTRQEQTSTTLDDKEEEVEEEDEEDEEEVEEEDEEDEEEVEEEDEEDEEPFDHQLRTRSGRVSRPVHKYVTTHQGHLQTQAIKPQEYSINNAKIIATTIATINHQFTQTYSLMKGIKEFGDKGRQAAHEEMKQLHDRIVFKPIAIEELSTIEKRRAMESLIFLTEKKDGRIKARTCANGSTQREYTNREEAASPTAMTESHLITAVIDAKQGRDVMTADIPNAFVQTEVEQRSDGEKIIMKIRGTLVDMLVDISPIDYQDFV
jgi:hypothetical protein